MIDTHAHLFDECYVDDFQDVLARANSAGVKRIVLVGYDIATSLSALKLAKTNPNLFPSIGIQPNYVESATENALLEMEKLLQEEHFIAIGEIGLDYYWNKKNSERQKMFFRKQLELACKYDLPVIVHCREAIEDTYAILKEFTDLKFVMHNFEGNFAWATKFITIGGYISLAGPITYKNAKDKIEIAKEIPLGNLVIETDSPYLSPVPFRGKRNEPAHLKHIVEKIAEIRDIIRSDLQEVLELNSKRLFNFED